MRPALSQASLVILGCAVFSSCTMIGGLERFVPAGTIDTKLSVDHFEPWQHELGGHGLRLGGSPGAVRIETAKQQLSVQCQEFAWYQNWFGPILPVFPVLMGAGPYLGDVVIRLHVEDGSQPIELSLDEVQVLPKDGDEARQPKFWSRVEQGRQSLLPLPAGTRVTLVSGDWLWLEYGVDSRSTSSFDLSLPVDGEHLTLQFDQEATPFLFTMP